MTPEQAAKLREPFAAEQIGKLPRAGITLDYVGHAATTDRLLQVDPEWTWEPMGTDDFGNPSIVSGLGEANEPVCLWINLTVCGVTRPGFGSGKTAKIAIGDAIRNAAMRFGVALDLWAKEDLHANGSAGEPRRDTRPSEAGPSAAASVAPSSAAAASSAESPFKPPSVNGQKPTKAQLASLIAVVDELIASGEMTSEQLQSAAKSGRPWPDMADTLDRATVLDLTGRLERFRENLKAAK